MIRFDKMTEGAQELFREAQDLLTGYKHNQLDVEHIAMILVSVEGIGREILRMMGINTEALAKALDVLLKSKPSVAGQIGGQVYITPRLDAVVQAAQMEAVSTTITSGPITSSSQSAERPIRRSAGSSDAIRSRRRRSTRRSATCAESSA